MNWALLAGSVAGVLALAAIAWMLRLGGGAIENAEAAMRIAREELPDFEPETAFVSHDGGAALVLAQSEAALLKQHGVHVAARRLPRPLMVETRADGVAIASGERMFGDVPLRLTPAERDRLLTMV